jgi:hypothetical protein
MRDVLNVTIGGMEFQLLPMPIMEAWKWDRKIMQILAPLIKSLSGMKEADVSAEPDSEDEEVTEEKSPDVDFSSVAGAITDALTALSDAELESLVKGMTKYANRIDCNPPIQLGSNTGVEKAFADHGPIEVYKLLFEIARYNKFSPFALAGGGNQIGGILGSFLPPAVKRAGMSLDRLATSTT